MTIAQLLECLLGKVAAIKGMEADGTAFNRIDIEKLKDELEKLGYERNATEYVYNGMTGQRLKIPIFIGPTYYQRLKHLVSDKLHCLTLGHEVLTSNGWISIDKITIKMQIATFYNGEVVYSFPTHIHKYNDNKSKKLYHILNDDIDLITTENHKVYVDNELQEINTIDNKIHMHYNMNGSFPVNHETDISLINSMEDVYCISVPSEIFYVKRNGKECWTGNSRARGPITTLTHQPPEGRSIRSLLE